jgi:NTP pyrophosphatase (non-canonical NTP hydrolase)
VTTSTPDPTGSGEWTLADLPAAAVEIDEHLKANGFDTDYGQVICLGEEAGEVLKAYRRWSGLARRTGPFEDVVDELADVVLAAAVLAARLDIDLTAAVAAKLGVVHTRGWREERAS